MHDYISTDAERKQSVESYKHKYAKQVLVEWLRSAARKVGRDREAEIFGLSWRINRGEPTWGIYEEYPVSNLVCKNGRVAAWDETSWGDVPSFEDLRTARQSVSLVLDVALLHKGAVWYGFEIVHTHRVDSTKAFRLAALNFPIYEIKAEWILRQVEPPAFLNVDAVYGQGRGVDWGLDANYCDRSEIASQ